MCNEYRVAWVGGEWVWLHRGIGGSETPAGSAELFPDITGEQYKFHVFPDRLAPVVRLAEDGKPEIVEMRWGFPSPQPGGRPVTNVRNLTSPYWRNWLKPEFRCLVPISEFCEFTETTPKTRKWFRLRDDTPFMFAGIWRKWTGVRGTKAAPVEGEHLVFAFLTCTPNKTVGAIHPRAMPVMLKREQWTDWLTAPVAGAMSMAEPFPDEEMAEPI